MHSLLAASGLLWQLGNRLGISRWTENTWVSVGAVAVAVAVAVLWAGTRLFSSREQRIVNSPPRLFRELCRAHRLSRRQVKLLQLLASLHGLDQPARLFLEPACFDAANAPALSSRQREYHELRCTLFEGMGR